MHSFTSNYVSKLVKSYTTENLEILVFVKLLNAARKSRYDVTVYLTNDNTAYISLSCLCVVSYSNACKKGNHKATE